MANPKIVVLMDGGLVQGVYTDQPVDLISLDFDTEGVDDDELVKLTEGRIGLNHPCYPVIRSEEIDTNWVRKVFVEVKKFLNR